MFSMTSLKQHMDYALQFLVLNPVGPPLFRFKNYMFEEMCVNFYGVNTR